MLTAKLVAAAVASILKCLSMGVHQTTLWMMELGWVRR